MTSTSQIPSRLNTEDWTKILNFLVHALHYPGSFTFQHTFLLISTSYMLFDKQNKNVYMNGIYIYQTHDMCICTHILYTCIPYMSYAAVMELPIHKGSCPPLWSQR